MSDEFTIFDTIYGTPQAIEVPVDNVGCQHHNVSSDYGITECLDCGIEIKTSINTESKMYVVTDKRSMGDGNRCWAPKKKPKSIHGDVKGLGFPDPIVNEADSIFKIVTGGGIFRVDKRKSIILSCISEAFRISGQPVSISSLLEKLPVDNVTAGMKIVETKIKKYDTERVRVTYTSPVDSIKDILAEWDNGAAIINDVIDIYNKIDDKSSLINRSRAKSVAAGVIYYYALATNRTNIKLREFAKRVKLSDSTIVKICKEVSAILETPEIMAY